LKAAPAWADALWDYGPGGAIAKLLLVGWVMRGKLTSLQQRQLA